MDIHSWRPTFTGCYVLTSIRPYMNLGTKVCMYRCHTLEQQTAAGACMILNTQLLRFNKTYLFVFFLLLQ